ncbi:hypothetical protein [Mesobacillus maritimus]|uniref:hypothetical protein n=1 Tax=Mesobacillus maritimus TaxID=1643336 RepID=UPI00384ED214
MDKEEIFKKLEAIQVHLLCYKQYKIKGYLEHTENMLWELIDKLKEDENGE